MNSAIYAKNLDKDVRLALYGMLEYSRVKLFPRHKNISVKLHLREHVVDGETYIDEFDDRRNPRDFRIVIDPYKLAMDEYDRTLSDKEWFHKLLRTVAHEMIHVKQYLRRELTCKTKGLFWKGNAVDWSTELDYYNAPHEVEAYGREKALFLGYLVIWNQIKKLPPPTLMNIDTKVKDPLGRLCKW